MSITRDLVAASATPMILSLLDQADSYGYAIIKQVEVISDKTMLWTDGMLYPILHRLERKQLIKSYWGQSQSGRRRKYYRILEAGRVELSEQMANWKLVNGFLLKLTEMKHV